MPSLCDWAGVEVPAGRQGVSIRPIVEKGDASVEGQSYVVSETDFSENGGGTMGWMVRSGNYKYVLYNMGLYREQLFDMTSDRGEMRNLAVEEKYTPVLEQYRRMLEEWMKKHPVKGGLPYLRYIPKGKN
jgi:arylsulfatase A-like enzyme